MAYEGSDEAESAECREGQVGNEGEETMTDTQIYIAIGVPMLFNAALVAVVIPYVNGQISGLNAGITSVEARMLNLENTFTTRFDLLMGRLTDLEKEIHKG